MHKSICMTPTMAVGLTRRPWSIADLLQAAQATIEPIAAAIY
jgi:hypothetical protein